MKCYKCERVPIEHGLSVIPIDLKGPGRRWVCTECATSEEVAAVPSDVKELCTAINPNFKAEG